MFFQRENGFCRIQSLSGRFCVLLLLLLLLLLGAHDDFAGPHVVPLIEILEGKGNSRPRSCLCIRQPPLLGSTRL